jgi:hypothetical protein
VLDRHAAKLDTPDGPPRDLFWNAVRILRGVDAVGVELAPDHYRPVEQRRGRLDRLRQHPSDD